MSLVAEIRAEIAKIEREKQQAAAAHSTSRYDHLVGQESGLRWCLMLLTDEATP